VVKIERFINKKIIRKHMEEKLYIHELGTDELINLFNESNSLKNKKDFIKYGKKLKKILESYEAEKEDRGLDIKLQTLLLSIANYVVRTKEITNMGYYNMLSNLDSLNKFHYFMYKLKNKEDVEKVKKRLKENIDFMIREIKLS